MPCRSMSAIGPKRTSLVALHMSALGGKADIAFLVTNRVLREMWEKANRAIDEQTRRWG